MIDHEESNDLRVETESVEKKNIQKKSLTNEEILGQSLAFLIASYGNITKALTYISYNLALYPEHQEKLLDEIDNVLENHVNPFSRTKYFKFFVFSFVF